MTRSYLNDLKQCDRRLVMETIEQMLPLRRLPDDQPYVPCPDHKCRQWRMYFQTDKVGRPDCPVCHGQGWVPESRAAAPAPCPVVRRVANGHDPVRPAGRVLSLFAHEKEVEE